MRLDGYIRVSRVGKRDTGSASYITETVQRDQIEAWAKSHGAEIQAWHLDRDESGGKTDRPGLNAALRRIETGQTGGLAVARLDRFARSLPGALEVIQRIDKAGGQFVSVTDGIDPTNAAGRLMRDLMLRLAQWELERITENWDIAQERAIERGVHFVVPFGYTRRQDGRLEPDKHAPLVREVFRRRAAGESMTALAHWLNQRCKTTTGAHWTDRTVKHLIDRRTYLGEARHGKHILQGAHEPIITPDEWDAAQLPKGVRPHKLEESLLAGVIRCAGCRYRMKTDRAGGHGGRPRVRIYRCRGRHGAGKCPAPASVTAELVEAHVEALFLNRYGAAAVAAEQGSRDLEDALRALEHAEAELDTFAADTRVRAALGHDKFAAHVEARAATIRDLERRVGELRGHRTLALMPGTWDDLTVPERRKLIHAGVGAVMLRRTGQAPIGRRCLVLWPSDCPDDLPGPGVKPVPVRSFDWPEDQVGVAGA